MSNEEDGESVIRAPSRLWALVSFVFAIPVFLVFTMNGYHDKGLFAGCVTMALVGVLRACWKLRNRSWFWITLFLMISANAVVTYFIHFDLPKYSIFATAPIIAIEYFGAYGIFVVLEKRLRDV